MCGRGGVVELEAVGPVVQGYVEGVGLVDRAEDGESVGWEGVVVLGLGAEGEAAEGFC